MIRPAAVFAVLALGACADANPLIGDWVIDLPAVPRAHGNLVRFRASCVSVSGNNLDTRIAAPVRYEIEDADILVWYGHQAELDMPDPARAAQVHFLASDRIAIDWPEGVAGTYLRTFASSESEAAVCTPPAGPLGGPIVTRN